MAEMQRWIVHVDLDAFFASVEELLNPSLCGKPLIVGGSPDSRGVVCSASYPARKYGVRSAMPVAQAVRLCPHAIVVPARHNEYGKHSSAVMKVLAQFSPSMEQVSIDEAFLDVTGCESLWGPVAKMGRLIQKRVRDECHLPVSLGIASSKLVAKIACDEGKPKGMVIVEPGTEETFLAPMPIERMWGVGRVTGEALRELGADTIGDLANMGENALVSRFGDHGRALYRNALGIDSIPIRMSRERRSISQERTFSHDVSDGDELQRHLLSMSERVASRLRRRQLVAMPVKIKMRTSDFVTQTRQARIEQPTDQSQTIYQQSDALLQRHWTRGQPLRLLGVGVSGLLEGSGYQLSLFSDSDQRQIRLSEALDEIREKYGSSSIVRASLLRKQRSSED